MNIDIIEKYFTYKKKNILEYTIALTKIVTYKPTVWDNRNSFKNIVNPVIEKIVNNNYFNDEAFTNTLDKFNTNEALSLLNNNDKNYLSLIITLALNLDYYNCALVKKDFNIKEYVNNKLKTINDYKINYKNIDSLLNKLKKNYKGDNNFFMEFNSLNLVNNYYCVSNKNKYYLVTYDFNLEELGSYKQMDVSYILNNNKYEEDIFELSLIYLNLLILKQVLILGKSDTFFIPFHDKYFKIKANINKFSKLLDNQYLQEKVKLLIYQTDVKKYTKEINALKVKGVTTMMTNPIEYEKLKAYQEIELINRREDI